MQIPPQWQLDKKCKRCKFHSAESAIIMPENKQKTYIEGLERALNLACDWSQVTHIRAAINNEIALEKKLLEKHECTAQCFGYNGEPLHEMRKK